MKKKLLPLVLLMTLFLFTGCVTVPEPEEGNSLLIGSIYQIGSGHPKNDGSRLNGKHTNGIILTFENVTSGEWIELRSSNGKFYSTKFPEGEYKLINLNLELKDSNGSTTSNMSFSSSTFSVKSNEVSNLGEIKWVSEHKTGGRFIHSRNFTYIKSLYFEDKESEWLNAHWNNAKL